MENIFTNAVKVAMSSMQSLTQDKEIYSMIKVLPIRAGGEIGEIFSWQKFLCIQYIKV